MKKVAIFAGGLLMTSLFLGACSPQSAPAASPSSKIESSDQAMMASTPPMMKEDGVLVGGAMMVPSKNIVENAMNASTVTTLVSAVKAAGLVETLSGPGPFTVFAPTNAAFDKVPAATLQGLLKPESKAQLASLLSYHVVPGRYVAADLKDGQKLKTVQGEQLMVVVQNGTVMIKDAKGNSATVDTPNVISSNGVTHVISSVLMPSKM